MPKRLDLRRIKSDMPYSVEELADILNVTEQTVRRWISEGMFALSEKRPALILGFQAHAFLEHRKQSKRRRLEPDEVYCFKCKAPRRPLDASAQYVEDVTGGRLVASCEVCGRRCNRKISLSQLAALSGILNISISANP